MVIDVNEHSLSELKQIRRTVDAAIATYEDRKLSELRSQLEEAARAKGFSLNDVIGGKKTRAKATPKYRNPADTEQTWSGRGRTPIWVQEALSRGATMDDLAIR